MNSVPAAGAATAIAAFLVLAGPISAFADDAFGRHWHDGKAEVSGYRYALTRYGERRAGQAVAIFVTEPFSSSRLVKVEDPARHPRDTFDVLKLNLVRDFQTGIYDYNTMASVFVRSSDLEPVKIAFTSTEWCGSVYEELRITGSTVRQQLHSYFEDESVDRSLDLPKGGVFEDELLIRLRGLRGDFLKPGESRSLPFLAGTFHRRLAHRPATWSRATFERLHATERIEVPAGTFETIVYVVSPGDGRQGRFWIERAAPYRVVRWSWTLPGPGGSTESIDEGTLQATRRIAYWTLNGTGGERQLRDLGLAPLPRALTPR